jgi:dihydroflavonol-4-reductase
MKVLLTGADGFLGSNISRELLKQGHSVRAFVIPGHSTKTLQGLPIEYFQGNLLNAQEVIEAMQGCEAVIHAAASTSMWPYRSAHVRAVNISGTQHILQGVLAAGISRLVYVSSASSFGYGNKAHPGDESHVYNSAKFGLDYMDSKKEAQDLVLAAVKSDHLPAVVVNPCFMFGPYDSKPSSGAMIVAICKGKVPGYSPGGRNYVSVKDVACGIVNALTQGQVGECYILGNANLSYREIFGRISAITGFKAPPLKIPAVMAKLYGRFGSSAGRLSGKPPLLSYPLATIACEEQYYSAAKAIRDLSLPQTPIDIAIQESFSWLKENGYVS